MGIEQKIKNRILSRYESIACLIISGAISILSILGLMVSLPPAVHCLSKAEQWKGSIKTEQGVTVVRNPQKPIFEKNIIEFEEELVIPESDGRNYIFVKPVSLALDDNNNIYVVDSREANIKVFNEYGQFLRVFGRKGAGPGELDVPGNLNIYKRNEIAVKDAGNRRITFYSLEGKYKRSLSTARFASGDMKIDSQGNIFCTVVTFRDGQRRRELQKFDSNLNYIKTFDYMDAPAEKELALFMAGPCFAILKGDLIVYGYPEKDYEIKIFNNEGILIKRILREYVPDRIPQQEIDFFTKNPGSWYIPKYYSPYYGIHIDDEGRIITNARYKLIENIKYFDVFSPEGKYLTTTSLKADFDGYDCVWKNDKLYTMGKDEDGLPEVKIYRIKWKDKRAKKLIASLSRGVAQ